jgi:hypothetical protein
MSWEFLHRICWKVWSPEGGWRTTQKLIRELLDFDNINWIETALGWGPVVYFGISVVTYVSLAMELDFFTVS